MASTQDWADALAWADPWLMPWFSVWGVPVSQLEGVACVLSLLMVACNLRVNPMGWPLAIVSSVLYGILFARAKLYGEACLQVLFVGLAFWGWWQWLRGQTPARQPLHVRSLSNGGRVWALGVALAMWPALGYVLDNITDSDVPYWDALPTAGSVVGQYLLGRKWVDNWLCWFVVNVVSMGLFAYKQLWLTVLLYGLFALLSVWGWRQWGRMAAGASSASASPSSAGSAQP